MGSFIRLGVKTEFLLKATDRITDYYRNRRVIKFTPDLLLDIHKIVLGYDQQHAGEFRDHRFSVVTEGATFKPTKPHLVRIKVHDLCEELNQAKPFYQEYKKVLVDRLPNYIKLNEATKEVAFVLFIAARAHHIFVDIHPFPDGNGRMARLIVSMVLKNFGLSELAFPPMLNEVILRRRDEYLEALHKADKGKILHFVQFLSEVLKESYEKTSEHLEEHS